MTLNQLLAALKKRAYEHQYTLCIGRSHGIHAEPVTFGLKLAQAYAEFERCKIRLQNARDRDCNMRYLRSRGNIC